MSDKKSEAEDIMEQINRDVDEIADMICRVQIIPKVMRSNFIGHIQLKLERVRLTLAENRSFLPSRDLQRLGKKLSTYDNRLRNEAIRKRKKWPNRKDDNCTIAVCCLSPAADLYLVRDSIIIMYPVRTSVMIESCINCTIACAAQQIRVKDCINCRLFLYTTGTTLLEECNAIEVGPYNVNFPNKEEIFKEGGFGDTENKWKEVEDLKMVNNGIPAFTIMNENELEEFQIE
ncbi:tubulin binding cofactor C family protein [Trichinella spiralis]|uniref:tubulin binding cofactor C family protein n=1 Tax=Trichinella spiralis TaxID=6334 RepID=UPI0001EFE2D4|nr:tubulin binding cofactor C family protein [Trichinella spiralis]